MSYDHPFQKLCCIECNPFGNPILVTACASTIHSFDLDNGRRLSLWPLEIDYGSDTDVEPSNLAEGQEDRPTKRRKLASDGLSRQPSEDSVEIVAERQKGQRRKPKVVEAKSPNVSHILATSDGHFVIAITAEDKCIRVFEVSSTGELNQRSQRCMPKRLCAIILTSDGKNILVGDKFGDVYLLPLHPSNDYVPRGNFSDRVAEGSFTPSATELTVHTRGNLEALRQQREQKKFPAKKEGPDFEHKLLLGHVSLLTDVAISEITVESKERQYILSADRDEHIRVSRGISQAHIIEGYCLGHREFVSKLCILPWAPAILVAGSGEPSLKVYNFQSASLLHEVSFADAKLEDKPLRQTLLKVLEEAPAGERTLEKLAISNIWTIKAEGERLGSAQFSQGFLLAAFEGLPALLSFSVQDDYSLKHHQTLRFRGNVLDVAVINGKASIIVSFDNVHEPGSMRAFRTDEHESKASLEAYSLQKLDDTSPESTLVWKESPFPIKTGEVLGSLTYVIPSPLQQVNGKDGKDKIYSALGEFLYGLENLRKRKGYLAVDDQDAGDADVVE